MKNVNYDKDIIINFLKCNGFIETDDNLWANDYCCVEIRDDDLAVCNNDGLCVYSSDLSIYWLLGVLIWKRFIDFEYKKATLSLINTHNP